MDFATSTSRGVLRALVMTVGGGLLVACGLLLGLEDHDLAGAGDAGADGNVRADAGDAGDGAASAPLALATGENLPLGMAADATNVYWVAHDGDAGTLRTVKKDGTGLRTLAAGYTEPDDVAVDATGVFWGFTNPTCYSSPFVERVSKDGATKTSILNGCYDTAYRITLDATNVFAAGGVFGGAVYRAAKDGTSSERLASYVGARMVAAAPGLVFWSDGTTITRFDRNGPDGGTAVLFAANQNPTDLAADAANVYWINDSGTVMSLGLNSPGGTSTTIASGQANPTRMALDDGNLYWANAGDGSVMTVPKSGGTPVRLAKGQGEPRGIAVDAQGVYWTNHADGRVMMLAR